MFKIYDGRIEFFQWDLDRKIIVEDPTIDEVHFCNKTDDCSLVVEVYEENGLHLANVPNILLQSDWDIRVYGYCGDCYTKQYERFKVVARTKPSDYVYTETEVRSLDYLENRLDEIEAMAKGAVGGKSFMDYPALIETLNAASNMDYAQAQHMLIKTLGVPDVWIYEVSAEHKPYTYVDDETFAAAVSEDLVQVGYYVLSALETQKVDLSDYLEKATNTTSTKQVYVKGENGNQMMFPMSRDVINEALVQRRSDGTIFVPTNTTYDNAAISKYQADANYVAKPTSTTYGSYVIPYVVSTAGQQGVIGDIIKIEYGNGANTIARRGANGVLEVGTPTTDLHAANKKYVDDNFLPNTSSTFTKYEAKINSYNQNGSMSPLWVSRQTADAHTIARRTDTGALKVGTPTTDNEAANKKYVDDLIASLQAQIDELKGV